MRNLIFVVCFVLALAIPLSGYAQETEEPQKIIYRFSTAERCWYSAKNAIQDGNYSLAKVKLEEALEADPSLADIKEFKKDCKKVNEALSPKKGGDKEE